MNQSIFFQKKERKNYSGKFQDLSEQLCLNHFNHLTALIINKFYHGMLTSVLIMTQVYIN